MHRHRCFVCDHPKFLPHVMGRRLLFGGGGRPADGRKNAKDGDFSAGLGEGGLPFGLDAQKLRVMQEMMSRQPLDKQVEMMKKTLEFQKTLGKIPGFGKLAQKNIEVMEHLVKSAESQHHQQQKSAPKSGESGGVLGANNNNHNSNSKQSGFGSSQSPNTATGDGGRSTSGPTIDELKKINLGPEIEALFAELALMRKKKNAYRDKLFSKEEELEKAQKELAQARETDVSLRTKLRKVEQDVMLLNSENMELKEQAKEWRQVRQKNEALTDTLQKMQQGDAALDRQRSDALQVEVREKEETLRSLRRKLERLRRRDPLLKFSRLCSSVARLCDAERDTARDVFDDAFAALQSCYEQEQSHAWETAVAQNGVGARAYAAVVRRFFLSRVSHANYDALVAVEGDVDALREFVKESGLTVQHVGAERYVIAAAEDTAASGAFLGPYGVSVGLYLAGKVGKDVFGQPFRLTAVFPHVSTILFNNAHRATVHYDTARSSGPGGQAANVTETQIIAKLFIDGQTAYVAEAQDSRSALSNREAATEKLGKLRRQQYNEQLAKQQRIEGVERQLVSIVKEQYSSDNDMGVDAVMPAAVVDMGRTAVSQGHLSRVDFGMMCGMLSLGQTATAAAAPASAST